MMVSVYTSCQWNEKSEQNRWMRFSFFLWMCLFIMSCRDPYWQVNGKRILVSSYRTYSSVMSCHVISCVLASQRRSSHKHERRNNTNRVSGSVDSPLVEVSEELTEWKCCFLFHKNKRENETKQQASNLTKRIQPETEAKQSTNSFIAANTRTASSSASLSHCLYYHEWSNHKTRKNS